MTEKPINQPYQRVTQNLKDIILNNFIGGIAWGLGATIGLAIVLGILGLILGKLNTIPVVGNFVVEIVKFVEENKLQTQ